MNNLFARCGVISSCDLMTKLIIVCWHGNGYHCSSLLQLGYHFQFVSLFKVSNWFKLHYISCYVILNSGHFTMASYGLELCVETIVWYLLVLSKCNGVSYHIMHDPVVSPNLF